MTGLAMRWQAKWQTSHRAVVAEVADRLAGWCFAILIVASPMAARFNLAERTLPTVPSSYTDFLLPFTYVGMLGILGLWALSVICRPRRLVVGPAFLWVPVAGLVGVSVAGIPFSVDPALAGFNVFRLLVVVAIGAYVVNEVDGLERLAVPVMVMIGIQAPIAIGQAAMQRSLGLTWLSELRMGVDQVNSGVIAAADGSRWLRAVGLTAHANILGGVIAFALVLLAAVQGEGARRRVLRLGFFALGVAVLFLTFSRSGWIALGTGLAVSIAMLAVRRDRAGLRRWAAAVSIAVVVAAVLAVPFAPFLAARANLSGPIATETRSIEERVALAEAAVAVIADHPVLGTGLGTLPLVLPGSEPDFEFAYQPAHIAALDAAAETGLVGLACYLALVIAPWIALVRVRARWTWSLAGASGALAAVTVVGLFDFYTWTASAGRTWAWIVLGLWVVTYRAALGGGEADDPLGADSPAVAATRRP